MKLFSSRWLSAAAVLGLTAATAFFRTHEVQGDSGGQVPAPAGRHELPAAAQTNPELTGRDIIALALEAAGGETFSRPRTLFLSGYNISRGDDGSEVLWDKYAMWRVFADDTSSAREASGKVRIEAWTGDNLALLMAFDGENTYSENGVMEDQSANAMWSANFGFGAIRGALKEGWRQARVPDRLVDGALAYMVEVFDPEGGTTLFGIRQGDNAIVYVGFPTPRGWHERRYSHYFTKPGISWKQAGRVRLFYDGVKSNEALWTDFAIGETIDNDRFVIAEPLESPSF